MELHFNMLWGVTGVMVIVLMILLVSWLLYQGILQSCCYGMVLAYYGGDSQGTQQVGAGEEGGQGQNDPKVTSSPR